MQRIVYKFNVFFYSPIITRIYLRCFAFLLIFYFMIKKCLKAIYISFKDNKNNIIQIWNKETIISFPTYKDYIKNILYLKYLKRNESIDFLKIEKISNRFCLINYKNINKK